MKHWFRNAEWLDGLFTRRKDEWFEWMSESRSAEFKAQIIATYQEDLLEYVVPPYFRELASERVGRCIPLAFGKVVESFDIIAENRPVWWFDPEHPDSLWLSIAEDFPAIFWVSVKPDDASIEAALLGNLAAVSKPVNELYGHQRLFAGTNEELQMELENFENHYVMTLPCSAHMWGSEFEYDPWPENSRDWTQVDKIVEFRRNMLQRQGRVPRTSFRTAFSRSVLTVEDHAGMFVFELRYDPQPLSEQAIALSKLVGSTYPADAPADLLAAILGFRNLAKPMFVDALNAGDFQFLWDDLLTLKVLISNPLEFELLLKKWIQTDDLEARRKITSIAHSCMFDAFLYERWALEPDPEIQQWLGAMLGPQVEQ